MAATFVINFILVEITGAAAGLGLDHEVGNIGFYQLDRCYRLLLPGNLGRQVNDLVALVFTNRLDRGKQGADGFAGASWRFDDQALLILNCAIDLGGKSALLVAKTWQMET